MARKKEEDKEKKVKTKTKVKAEEKVPKVRAVRKTAGKKALVKEVPEREPKALKEPQKTVRKFSFPWSRKKKEEVALPVEKVLEAATEEVLVEESKYYPGPIMQKFPERRAFEFPVQYGDNKIILMVRDPYWLYAYWEVNQKRKAEIRSELGEAVFNASRECLRVYNVDSWEFFDIEVTGGAKSWYIRVSHPNVSYCVDIGYKTPDGRFIAAARSNVVTTPLDRMSDVIDEQWMIPDWDKLYALSGGFKVGTSSEQIRELWKQRLESESASGWMSSGELSSGGVRPAGERPFWLWVKTDVIVYGATEPSATLAVQGRKVALRPDGTFSLRYELPEGKHFFPVEAIRDDGLERRQITPVVKRTTE